jgi:hypothetical protein
LRFALLETLQNSRLSAGFRVLHGRLFRLNGGALKASTSAKSLRLNVNAGLIALRETQGVDLSEEILPLCDLCEGMREYLEQLDKSLAKIVKEHAVCASSQRYWVSAQFALYRSTRLSKTRHASGEARM